MSRIFSVAGHRRSGYDIPLHLKLGTEFLVLLIALMTFLSLLAAIGSMMLGHMSHSWTSGLENSLTIEVPSEKVEGDALVNLLSSLQKIDGVLGAEQLDQDEMQKLLSPWLGEHDDLWNKLPIPVLVTVTMEERSDGVTERIRNTTHKIMPDARVDAHEEWLTSLLKLAHGLNLSSLLVLLSILAVTVIVIAGAVRSRMAIHHKELELLHIMGATDRYITGQFVRYIVLQALKGAGIGTVLALILTGLFEFLSQKSQGTLPDLSLQGTEWLIFIAMPLLLVIMGALSARYTALRILQEMP